MQVETLREALAAGWRVHARCLEGTLEYTRSKAKCRHQAELSLETLAWTPGRNMPLSGLRERMMCPRCGNRRVNLIFEPPAARSGRLAEGHGTTRRPRQSVATSDSLRRPSTRVISMSKYGL
jgi:hypothetical protein